MKKRSNPATLLLLLTCALLPARPAAATTVVPPADLGALVRASRSVVFAQAVESRVEEGDALPSTITRFLLLRPVAGADPGLVFEVREPGGSGQRRAAAVAGAPRFEAGRSYLLFLDPAPGGRWRSKMMAYGLLEEVEGADLLRPLPEAAGIEVLSRKSYEPAGLYRKEALLEHLREVGRGAPWNRQQVAAPETALQAQGAPLETAVAGEAYTAPSGCVFLTHDPDGLPIRWFGYETGAKTVKIMATTPGQTGIADGGASAVQAGVAAWTDHPDSVIRYLYGGSRARSISCSSPADASFDYDDGAVVFDDPCGDIADLTATCAGTLAFGGAIYDPTKTSAYDGQQWHAASSTFVVVNNGTQCVGETNFKEVLAHELGHTQGFGHHNPPDPATALMSPKIKGGGLGATLLATDKVCAEFAYHTFLDVPYSRWSWSFVEAIENASIDGGCGAGNYCPTSQVTRASMSVFLVRGQHGGTYVPPPATGTVFEDIPASHPQAAYIEQLYRDGLTGGCSTTPRRYCPDDLVSRAQMATFLIRIGHGNNYTPPPATGTVFQDVPAGYWGAPFIEQLYAEGGTAGCGTNPLRYCPESILVREEIATFLVRAYHLPLP